MPNAADEMMARYENRIAEEEAEKDAILPPGARDREKAMQDKANTVLSAARGLIGEGMIEAVGYRVVVFPIEAQLGLEAAEAEQFEHLAAQDFQVKSEGERKREERGENHGIVMSIGPVAFEGRGGRSAWCDEGDVVVFARYAGTRVEHPPGSGKFYQVMNDEDVFARIK